MSYKSILFEIKNGAAWITLNRPDALNAIDAHMLEEVPEAVAKAGQDENVRCVVLTGQGRAFCAGADLKNLRGILGRHEGNEIHGFFSKARVLFESVAQCPKPVIAAVNGVAAAGGIEFILACDLVIAAQTARIGDAHANYGVIPGGGGTVNLPRKIGVNRAKQLLFTGDLLPAATLCDWGLVNQVVEDDSFRVVVEEWAAKLASKSPLVLRRMKQLVEDGLEAPRDVALRMETAAWEAHGKCEDVVEGLDAFVEKRRPIYKGR